VTLAPVLSIEPGGRIVRGLALPFGSSAYVVEGNDVIEEVMDEDSLDGLPGRVPLLEGHDRTRAAIGVARNWAVIPGKGLGVEAELVVSDSELDAWHRRFNTALPPGCPSASGMTSTAPSGNARSDLVARHASDRGASRSKSCR
jgi:hypothetical protein